MGKYKAVIFDMDGTLVNTYRGIFNSYTYAAEKMGLVLPDDALVGAAIGAPLSEVFASKFGLDEGSVRTAVSLYRHYYAENGFREVEIYDGIRELLSYLRDNGYKLAVATLKREDFAVSIVKALELDTFFDVVYGIDDNDKLTKSDIINKCLAALSLAPDAALYVGDSSYDAIGSAQSGLDFAAVTYGFGFKNEKDVEAYKHCLCAAAPHDIIRRLEKN